jgi:hypothetical protein
LRKLGPDQVVVLGMIGERVGGGRVFHVERWFNGGVPAPMILIAFKEGEPVGDCSYLVSTGQRLIIAPYRDGALLRADLATLQGHPDSEQGGILLEEAVSLYGPGVVPEPIVAPTVSPSPRAPVPTGTPTPLFPTDSKFPPGSDIADGPLDSALAVVAIALVLGGTLIFISRRRTSA